MLKTYDWFLWPTSRPCIFLWNEWNTFYSKMRMNYVHMKISEVLFLWWSRGNSQLTLSTLFPEGGQYLLFSHLCFLLTCVRVCSLRVCARTEVQLGRKAFSLISVPNREPGVWVSWACPTVHAASSLLEKSRVITFALHWKGSFSCELVTNKRSIRKGWMENYLFSSLMYEFFLSK